MAYADQQGMSTNRMIAIILVVLLHAGIGFALVSGLAYEAIKKVKEKMEVIDIQEEKPPEEEPPPPPEDVIVAPPPQYAPPSPFAPSRDVPTSGDDTPVNLTPDPSVECPGGGTAKSLALCQDTDPLVTCPSDGRTRVKQSQLSTCPPKPENKQRALKPKNNPGSWATTNDYPSRALSQEREGTTGFRVTVGPDGKVTDCQVTSSSGHADLDAATCSNVKRRARFDPALDNSGNPTSGSYSNRVTWRIPKD